MVTTHGMGPVCLWQCLFSLFILAMCFLIIIFYRSSQIQNSSAHFLIKAFFHIHTSVSILEGQWCVLFRAHTPASKLSPTDVTNSVISEEPGFKPDMWVPWVHERNFKIEQQRKRKKHKILFRLEFWKVSFSKGLEMAWVWEPDQISS